MTKLETFKLIDGVHPELCPFLRDEILDRSHAPSFGSRNVGGWKSHEDFTTWRVPAVNLLVDRVQREIDALEVVGGHLVGWAMVNRNGSYHKRHSHGGLVVGIYYVTIGDPPIPTVFEIDRIPTPGYVAQADSNDDGSVVVERAVDPVVGRLVLFPAHMWHRVPVYNGTDPRITVAFEVRP